jgi:LacI family transcriptional regulator
MNDVAADAGVSLKTVSRVVNNVGTVDPVLVERVVASIAKLGFRRNEEAASLRSGGLAKTIGLVTAVLGNSFYTAIASGVMRMARENGYQVIMASSEEDPQLERELAIDLCRRRVSGLIVVPLDGDHSFLQSEITRGTPVVFIDRPAVGVEADAVLIDNRGGARSAMDVLLSSGHSRIAIILDSLGIYTMRERLAGAREALIAAGITEDPDLMTAQAHTPDEAAELFGRMLDLEHPPTAVLCGNNRGTIGVVEELARRARGGHDAPKVHVVGFDDFEMSRLLPSPVTLVDYDIPELGALAAQRLLARIGGDATPPQTLLLPTRLVQRGGALGGSPRLDIDRMEAS